jgi:hypothetical protein
MERFYQDFDRKINGIIRVKNIILKKIVINLKCIRACLVIS